MKITTLLLALATLTNELELGVVRAFADPPAQRRASAARLGTEPRPHLDRYGDPLPPRAVCRLGMLRLLHRAFVTNAAFSPDGRRFASTAVDGTLVTWDWPNGKNLQQFSYATKERHSLQFSADNGYLAGFDGKAFVIWNLSSNRPIFRSVACRYSLFSSDSKRIAWLKDARSLCVLMLGTDKEPETTLRRHDVLALGYDKGGRLRIMEYRGTMLSLRDLKGERAFKFGTWKVAKKFAQLS